MSAVRSILRAKYDYRPEDTSTTEELSFNEKEIIFLLIQDESGWAKGKKPTGETGWFPLEFTEEIYVVPPGGTVPPEYGNPNVPARPAVPAATVAAAAAAAATAAPAVVTTTAAGNFAGTPGTHSQPPQQTWTAVLPGQTSHPVAAATGPAPSAPAVTAPAPAARERSGTSDSDGSGLDLTNGSDRTQSASNSDDGESETGSGIAAAPGAPLEPPSPSSDPRKNIVLEVLSTERTYVASLNTIIVMWFNPLRDGTIIETKFLPKIFCNVEQIFHVHRKFLARLEQRIDEWSDVQIIGDMFLSMISEFAVYEEYLTNHHTAIATVNALARDRKNFAAWMQMVQRHKDCHRMDLLSFLIAPVQRILRYKLLIEDLRKRTVPNHPDAANLVEVARKIGELAQSINENIRAQENFQKLCSIQQSFQGSMKSIVVDGRKFVREGPVMKICRKTEKPRWFFLFNDVLVYASVVTLPGARTDMRGSSAQMSTRNPGTGGVVNSFQRFLFHRMLSLETTRVKDLPDTPTVRNGFQIMTQDVKSFVVYTGTPTEKEAWLKDFVEVTQGSDLGNAAPVWTPDKEVKACPLCQSKFTVITRRHHCRMCGRVVCGNCSTQSCALPGRSEKPVRVCDPCYEDFRKRGSQSEGGSQRSFGEFPSSTRFASAVSSAALLSSPTASRAAAAAGSGIDDMPRSNSEFFPVASRTDDFKRSASESVLTRSAESVAGPARFGDYAAANNNGSNVGGGSNGDNGSGVTKVAPSLPPRKSSMSESNPEAAGPAAGRGGSAAAGAMFLSAPQLPPRRNSINSQPAAVPDQSASRPRSNSGGGGAVSPRGPQPALPPKRPRPLESDSVSSSEYPVMSWDSSDATPGAAVPPTGTSGGSLSSSGGVAQSPRLPPRNNSAASLSSSDSALPSRRAHDFEEQTFMKPTFCGVCDQLLWGLVKQGLKCRGCGFAVHHACQSRVTAVCTSSTAAAPAPLLTVTNSPPPQIRVSATTAPSAAPLQRVSPSRMAAPAASGGSVQQSAETVAAPPSPVANAPAATLASPASAAAAVVAPPSYESLLPSAPAAAAGSDSPGPTRSRSSVIVDRSRAASYGADDIRRSQQLLDMLVEESRSRLELERRVESLEARLRAGDDEHQQTLTTLRSEMAAQRDWVDSKMAVLLTDMSRLRSENEFLQSELGIVKGLAGAPARFRASAPVSGGSSYVDSPRLDAASEVDDQQGSELHSGASVEASEVLSNGFMTDSGDSHRRLG